VHDTGRGLPNKSSDVFLRYSPGVSPVSSPAQSGGGSEAAGKAEAALKDVETHRAGLEEKLSFTNAKKGLGFGLTLTYGLVRSLGGELRFRSAEAGGNTAFSFEVDAVGASAASPATSRVMEGATKAVSPAKTAATGWGGSKRCNWDSVTPPTDVPTTNLNLIADSPTSSPVQTGAGARAFEDERAWAKVVAASCVAGQGLTAMDKPHVLVVEDTELCADVIRQLLRQLGCSSDHAADGEEALEKLVFGEPGLHSLVLMDLRMPKKDGFDATAAIKKLNIGVPVVALTADDTAATRKRCHEIGFDGFATKPLRAMQLAALLEKHVGHKVEPVV